MVISFVSFSFPATEGLYTDLSNNLPPAFLEQLCDLVLRNIETVIEPKDVSAPTDSSEMLDRCEDEDGENIRKNYSVRIQLKSRDQ